MISKRKLEHIEICISKDVRSDKKTLLGCVEFVHKAVPGLDKSEIDLSTTFLGKKLDCPIIIAAMTGGHEISEKINKNLAKAAQELGLGMGLGSQRPMLEDDSQTYTYQVRDVAPGILLLGNIGAPQLGDYSPEQLKAALEKIKADALAIHLNNLQEAVQPEGETHSGKFMENIEKVCKNLGKPVIVKETGAGISKETAEQIISAGAAAIDVGGAGGTSFSAVESFRSKSETGETFKDWGIPTAASILEVRSASKEIPIMATGGIRTGLDAARAIALGADVVGIALPLLEPAKQGPEKVREKLEEIINELRTAMYLTGAKNIQELKNTETVISGALSLWQKSRKL